ncbi:pantetheine-phosphate adenylyltransferase [Lacticaseibacillus pabuli]|uniref:Phosphopantetheine adenylyltransferase n=1 Tax=Lacticaseibacillus pabuli TaxID=3025672 RepID=A0ABY7WXN0_9LACO|nr:pantetheine-phosphate adenylyltransferase [Lacticaseibacillus sp. KACC 23028]WDF83829.1 pantetheine-phosphate adenylyltransferase [Lacticaseibacillus sp. KACC 23028]
MTKAIFPGSFDPFTNGHLATVERASKMFDHVIITVMTNTSKQALFSADERAALITEVVAGLDNVSVLAGASELTVELAQRLGASFIVRGLRNASDYTFENEIALANAKLRPNIQTVLLPARATESGISSSIVKEIASFGGDVSQFVPRPVAQALEAKFGDAYGKKD